MEILVAILVIALLVAVAFIVIQRRPGGAGGPGRPRTARAGRPARVPRNDPMAAAVVEHAQATDPQEVVAAERRLREEARRTAAPMQAEAERAEHQRAADQMAQGRTYAEDPQLEPADGYVDPASDPRYDDRRR